MYGGQRISKCLEGSSALSPLSRSFFGLLRCARLQTGKHSGHGSHLFGELRLAMPGFRLPHLPICKSRYKLLLQMRSGGGLRSNLRSQGGVASRPWI